MIVSVIQVQSLLQKFLCAHLISLSRKRSTGIHVQLLTVLILQEQNWGREAAQVSERDLKRGFLSSLFCARLWDSGLVASCLWTLPTPACDPLLGGGGWELSGAQCSCCRDPSPGESWPLISPTCCMGGGSGRDGFPVPRFYVYIHYLSRFYVYTSNIFHCLPLL